MEANRGSSVTTVGRTFMSARLSGQNNWAGLLGPGGRGVKWRECLALCPGLFIASLGDYWKRIAGDFGCKAGRLGQLLGFACWAPHRLSRKLRLRTFRPLSPAAILPRNTASRTINGWASAKRRLQARR